MGGGKGGGGGGGKGGGSAPQAKIPTQQIAEMENKFNQLGTYEAQFLNYAPAEANFGLNVATGGQIPNLPTSATGLGQFQIPGVGGAGGGAGGGGGAGTGVTVQGAPGYGNWLQSLGPLMGGTIGDINAAAQAITGGPAPGVQQGSSIQAQPDWTKSFWTNDQWQQFATGSTQQQISMAQQAGLDPTSLNKAISQTGALPGGGSGTILQNAQGQKVAMSPQGQYYWVNPDGSVSNQPLSLSQVSQMGFLSQTGLPAQQQATIAETQGLQAQQQNLFGMGQTAWNQGQNLFNMATTGTGLFPSQQAFVNQATSSEQAALQQQMANAGLSSSTQNAILQGEAAQQGAATAGQLVQGNIQLAEGQEAVGAQMFQLSNQAAQLTLAGQGLSLQQENALIGQTLSLAQENAAVQQQGWNQAMQGQGQMGALLQNVLGPFQAQANMIALQTEANIQNASIAAQFEAAQNQAASSGMSSLFSGLLGMGGQGGLFGSGGLGGLGSMLGLGGAGAGLAGAGLASGAAGTSAGAAGAIGLIGLAAF